MSAAEKIEALRLALRPFALVAEQVESIKGADKSDRAFVNVTLGECRAARAALERIAEF